MQATMLCTYSSFVQKEGPRRVGSSMPGWYRMRTGSLASAAAQQHSMMARPICATLRSHPQWFGRSARRGAPGQLITFALQSTRLRMPCLRLRTAQHSLTSGIDQTAQCCRCAVAAVLQSTGDQPGATATACMICLYWHPTAGSSRDRRWLPSVASRWPASARKPSPGRCQPCSELQQGLCDLACPKQPEVHPYLRMAAS